MTIAPTYLFIEINIWCITILIVYLHDAILHLCKRVLFNNNRYSNLQSLNYSSIFTPADVYFYRYVYIRGGALKRPIFKNSIRYKIKKIYNKNELLIYQTGVRNMTIMKKKITSITAISSVILVLPVTCGQIRNRIS